MMGYVSLTAPRFTEEDERRELANQSLAEQEEIERDVFGHESGFVKDTDLMKVGRSDRDDSSCRKTELSQGSGVVPRLGSI